MRWLDLLDNTFEMELIFIKNLKERKCSYYLHLEHTHSLIILTIWVRLYCINVLDVNMFIQRKVFSVFHNFTSSFCLDVKNYLKKWW